MMKTISKLFGVVAAIAALAACNKEVADNGNLPEGFKTMTLTVSSNETKVYMTDDASGNLSWNNGDELAVIFNGDSHAYKFVNPLGSTNVFQNAADDLVPAGYEFENITDVYYPYISANADYYETNHRVPTTQDCLIPGGDYGYTTDRFEFLPMHWEQSYGTTSAENMITMYADRTAMVKIGKDYVSPVEGKVKVIFDNTVYTINTTSDKDLIFLVDVPSGEVVNPYFRVNWGSATPSYMSTDGVKKLEAGKRYQLVYVDYGILPGLFSVSETKKVYFSQGNLYYDGSKFNFEANQYGFNSSYQSTYVSHFYWSKDASVAYANSYNESGTTESDVFFTNETVTTAKAGFTVNVGGKEHSGWRTLSHDEWQYLFNTRTVNGGQGAGKSYSLNITYGGKMGLVLYPDDYDKDPVTGTVTDLPVGVVFLPAAGYRLDSNVGAVGVFGYYWSSTADDIGWAYVEGFNSSLVTPPHSGRRDYCYSVRLVTDAN